MNEHEYMICDNDDRASVVQEVGNNVVDIKCGEVSFKIAVIVRNILERPEDFKAEIDRLFIGR